MSESKFRALCTELADNLSYHCGDNEYSWDLIERVRAELAASTHQIQLRGVEWEDEDDDGTTPGWKQLARQGR